MARNKKNKKSASVNNSNMNNNFTNATTNNINNIGSNIPSVSFAEDFSNRFMNQYTKFLSNYANSNFYNPIYANSALKRFNTNSLRPTEDKLIKWFNNPRYHEQEIRGCGDFLFNAVMQYNRSAAHFASIMNFDYELIPLNPPTLDADKKTIDLYKKQKLKNCEWLRKFRIKEQFQSVMFDVMRDGGNCYYLRESEDAMTLQPMPQDYVYINGRTDYSYTFSLNMSFFLQFPESTNGFAPEFYEWYQEFLNKKELLNEKANPYRMMPVEKSVVFKWDNTRPEMIPPLASSFKDAINIQDYKDLLKLNAELQTYQIMYLQAPLDKDGKPTVSAQEIINYVSIAQSLAPPGTGVISTPMELNNIKFNNSQNMNNITGTGEQSYWSSVGVAGGIFGSDTKSAVALKQSVQADYNYVKHMYDFFEKWINFQLSMIDGKFNFKIRFLRRNEFFIEDDKKSALTFVQSGGSPSRLLSAYGYEPFEHESILIDSHISEVYNLMRPLKTSYTLSNNQGGRPTAEESGKEVSDSNSQTREGSYNDGKFSQLKCKNCETEIDMNNEFAPFCSESCMEEWFEVE